MSRVWTVLLLVACAVLPFLPAVSPEFVLEDRELLATHPVVTGAVPPGHAFTMSFYGIPPPGELPNPYYRPLVLLWFRAEALLWGALVVPRHLINLALHAANALLVWALLRRRVVAPRLAFLGAALFAVHPAQAGAVAWVAGRTDVLAATFGLLVLLTQSGPASPQPNQECPWPALWNPRGPRGFLRLGTQRPWLRGVLFLLALLAKESAVVVPLVALALDEGRWRARLWRSLPLALGGLAYLVLRAACFPSLLPQVPIAASQALLQAPATLGMYLRQLVLPFPTWWQRAVPVAASSWLPALGLIPAFLGAWHARTRAATLWCVFGILPVCGVLPLVPWQPDAWTFSPRFLYFSVAGLALLAATLLPARVMLVLVLSGGVLCGWHASDFRSTETLVRAGLRWDQDSAALWLLRADVARERWESASDPTARAAFAREGRDAAERAVVRCPTWYAARRTLAFLMALAGDPGGSEQLHRILLRENLRDPMVPSNLAVVLATQGRLDQARALWQEALRRQPDFAPARSNLDRLRRGR